MHWPAAYSVILPLIVVAFVRNSHGTDRCELENMLHGCKIQNSACTCGYGCKTEYHFNSLSECNNAKGRGGNICHRLPCLNGGSCIQIPSNPGFKCRCESTGYYGARCEKVCPGPLNNSGKYPYECVVI